MQESMVFSYDGQSSKKFGVYMAHAEGGLYKEPFLPQRKIIEKKISNREKPYFQAMEQEPLQFPMTIVIKEWDSIHTKRQIARWLFQDYYKPLYFESNPERIYYAIVEGTSEIYHNGITDQNREHAYINVNIRCDSPYAYTPEYPLPNIKFRDGNKEKIIDDKGLSFFDGVMNNAHVVDDKVEIKDAISNWIEFQQAYKYWSEVK